MTTTDELLSTLIRRACGDGVRLPEQPLPHAAWSRVVRTAVRERIVGVLVSAVQAGLPTTDRQFEQLDDEHRLAMTVAASLEAQLPSITVHLDDAGIEHRLMKGLAAAHHVYADAALRQYGDIDLLVRPRDFTSAQAALVRGGFDRLGTPHGPVMATVAKERLFRNAHGGEIDLHQSLARGRRWLRSTDDLFDDPVQLDLPSGPVLALSVEGMLLNACVASAYPGRRLSTVVDHVLLVRRNDLDWHRFDELVTAARADEVIRLASAEVERWVPGGSVAAHARPSRTSSIVDRAAMRLATSAVTGGLVGAASTLPAHRFPVAMWELVWPDPERLRTTNQRRDLVRVWRVMRKFVAWAVVLGGFERRRRPAGFSGRRGPARPVRR